MLRDESYLLDMLIAARHIREFIGDISKAEFEQNYKLQLAVEKLLENMGEAANRISPATKAIHSQFPWQEIIGMRNRLIHEYFRINLNIVWETVHDHIPSLVEQLNAIVPPDQE